MRSSQCGRCLKCYNTTGGKFCISKGKLISKIPRCATWTEIKKENARQRKGAAV